MFVGVRLCELVVCCGIGCVGLVFDGGCENLFDVGLVGVVGLGDGA